MSTDRLDSEDDVTIVVRVPVRASRRVVDRAERVPVRATVPVLEQPLEEDFDLSGEPTGEPFIALHTIEGMSTFDRLPLGAAAEVESEDEDAGEDEWLDTAGLPVSIDGLSLQDDAPLPEEQPPAEDSPAPHDISGILMDDAVATWEDAAGSGAPLDLDSPGETPTPDEAAPGEAVHPEPQQLPEDEAVQETPAPPAASTTATATATATAHDAFLPEESPFSEPGLLSPALTQSPAGFPEHPLAPGDALPPAAGVPDPTPVHDDGVDEDDDSLDAPPFPPLHTSQGSALPPAPPKPAELSLYERPLSPDAATSEQTPLIEFGAAAEPSVALSTDTPPATFGHVETAESSGALAQVDTFRDLNPFGDPVPVPVAEPAFAAAPASAARPAASGSVWDLLDAPGLDSPGRAFAHQPSAPAESAAATPAPSAAPTPTPETLLPPPPPRPTDPHRPIPAEPASQLMPPPPGVGGGFSAGPNAAARSALRADEKQKAPEQSGAPQLPRRTLLFAIGGGVLFAAALVAVILLS